MKLRKVSLKLGIERPIRLLHLSDTHLSYADERDNERKRSLAVSRARDAFESEPGSTMRHLDEALAYGKANCDLMIHTGDMIDFVSERNLELLEEKLSVMDSFFAAGNHEYSQYVGEAWEDHAYKMLSFARVQARVKNDLVLASHVIAGLNLVAVDNVYYNFTADELTRLKAEAAKGMPILLMMHNPLHCSDLYSEMRFKRKSECAYLVGTPEAMMADYSDYRRRQQHADAETLAFIDYIKSEPMIKAIAAGHLHFDYQTTLYGRLPMIVTGGGFSDLATELDIE